MNTRKLVCAFVVLCVAGLLMNTGCQNDQDKAQQTLADYVVADTIGSKKSVMPFLAAADREVLEEQFKDRKDNSDVEDELFKLAKSKLGDQIKVTVTESKVDGDKMSVTADVTTPDEKALDMAILKKLGELGEDNKDASKEEKEKLVKEAVTDVLENEEFESVKSTQTYELRKENEKWLVFIDLKTQQEIREIVDAGRSHSIKGEIEEARAKLDEAKKKLGDRSFEDAQRDINNLELSILYDEARTFEREQKFAEAIANFNKVIEINPDWKFAPIDTERAKEKVAELEKKKAQAEAQAAYIEKILLDGIEVKDSFGSKRIVGELKNGGDQILDKVELAIKFFDKDGNEVHADSNMPVIAGGDEARAFKPGHSKKFTKYATNAPDAWDGKIEVKVNKVEFFAAK